MGHTFNRGGRKGKRNRDNLQAEKKRDKEATRRAKGAQEQDHSLHVLYCGPETGYDGIKALLESVGKIGVHYQDLNPKPDLDQDHSLLTVNAIIVDCMVADGTLSAEGLLGVIASDNTLAKKTVIYHGPNDEEQIRERYGPGPMLCSRTDPGALLDYFNRLLQQRTARQE